jgi:hypothetical protein
MGTIELVLLISTLSLCAGFGIFLWKHQRGI